MKLCDRCRVPGCLLDYGGKACQEARKKYCPDVVFTHADKIREMDDEALAFIIMCPRDDGNKCKNCGDVITCIACCLDWLRESAERVFVCAGCAGARLLPGFHAGRSAEKLEDHQQRKNARR